MRGTPPANAAFGGDQGGGVELGVGDDGSALHSGAALDDPLRAGLSTTLLVRGAAVRSAMLMAEASSVRRSSPLSVVLRFRNVTKIESIEFESTNSGLTEML